jgi:hypothetical protein
MSSRVFGQWFWSDSCDADISASCLAAGYADAQMESTVSLVDGCGSLKTSLLTTRRLGPHSLMLCFARRH